jgi:hypothetical protein
LILEFGIYLGFGAWRLGFRETLISEFAMHYDSAAKRCLLDR